MKDIQIRKYKEGEELELWNIYYETIRTVNIKDYSQLQVEAWAPEDYDNKKWVQRIKGMNPFIATNGKYILGYADVQNDGHIDPFLPHKL